MTEDEAQSWINDNFGATALTGLRRFAAMLIAENQNQNLVAASTIPEMWSRHIIDSAQLVPFAAEQAQRWCDVGSGAGLPGLVISILHGGEMWLVEPRPRRVSFLESVVSELGLDNVQVIGRRIERLTSPRPMDVITARAVAALPSLFAMTQHLTSPMTRFILPKGRNGRAELASLGTEWQGVFHVEQSISDPESTIIIADGVTRRCSASR